MPTVILIYYSYLASWTLGYSIYTVSDQLFIAAITSVMALAQPFIAFLEDEYGFSRSKAVAILGALWLPSTHLCILLSGSLDVVGFWAGTFGPPLFALIEIILMMWIVAGEKMWAELHAAPRFVRPASSTSVRNTSPR